MKRELDPDVRLLQALADPVRLSIVRQLGETEAVCACDFDACGTVSQPTVSHHLRILREAGIVRGERRGTWIWYALEPEALARARGILEGLRPGPARPLATAARRSAGSRSAGSRSAGSRSAGSRSAGSRTAGSRTAGSRTAGSRSVSA